MTKEMQQITTLDYFEKKASHANRKEKLFLNEERTEFMMYHPTFSKSKRTALIQELLEYVTEAHDKKYDLFENEGRVNQFLQYLMIRYFTDMKALTDSFTLEEHIALMRTLIDTEMLDYIVLEVFDLDEVSKVLNEYNLAKERLVKVSQQLEQQAKINKQAQNAQRLHEKKMKAVKK